MTQRAESARWIGRALQIGVVLAAGAIAVGLVAGLGRITFGGLVILLLTPAAGATIASAALWRRERTYALIAIAVLALLVGSLVAAVVLAPHTGG